MFLVHFRPYIDPQDLNAEVFNDIIAYVIMVILRLFNQEQKGDFIAEDED
jgi:hypothetical protein